MPVGQIHLGYGALNAYDEEGGRVVVDVIQYAGAYDVSQMSGHGPLTLDRGIL